jgi:predicted metal-dependent enzyme (double-stranded beta helix superfamily)
LVATADTGPVMTVRQCVDAVIEAIDAHGDDPDALAAAMAPPVRRLMARPDLLSLGIPRQANHVSFSEYLYYDGRISVLIYEVPTGRAVQAHDHGIWESLFVYRGRVEHTVYRRTDDGKKPGYAELEVVDQGVLGPGDFSIVAPPADIHSFRALDEGTYGITIVDGAYKADRHYYQPESNSYVVRPQKNAR